ncbi:MAG: tRNA uridine-5-carboxymethylaminomethyl(34) synthesis GTPase MnmE [Lachnospiraceae bacterium]|jgi:tRNA modification GTPase|nr:tRNA uridine-5-carboxymethylaminomethyl(34) synthesis GTPase MnmE [Lachnospiraceae bacterium]
MKQDTIAAIATPMMSSGIGIVRISGEAAFSIIEEIFRPKNSEKQMTVQPSYSIHYGTIYDGNEMLDEVLVLLMRGPHSYTAEDVAEIDCHGGVFLLRRILETVLKNGARIAEPGEFTKRAFLNGRIDLSQAEAVMDVIQAKNQMALKTSVSQLKGSLSSKVKDFREKILYETAFLEAALDDPEHMSLDGYGERLFKVLEEFLKETKDLLSAFENGRMVKEGIKTVILGKPNAGKSSLLNALLGEERAIVTDIAGTTRDVLEEQLSLSGIYLKLLDTAGIRKTEDLVEQIGVSRAKEQAETADLILYVVDGSCRLDESDEEILKLLEGKKAIVLLNKSDLETIVTEEELKSQTFHPVIAISAKEREGFQKLEEKLCELFFQGGISFDEELILTNVRHKEALEDAEKSLLLVRDSILAGMPEDFYTIDLMGAYTSLGRILGEDLGEDLVEEIFGKFCTGK